MDISIKDQIIKVENKLKLAMLDSDVIVLDELLAPELIFTNHLGHVFSKQDDIGAHQSGIIKIKSITTSEQTIKLSNGIAIASVRAVIIGSFAGNESETDLRFTRIWAPAPAGGWQIVAGHSSVII